MRMLGASFLLICNGICPGMGTSCHREVTHVLIFPLAIGPGDHRVFEMPLLSIIRRWHPREEIAIREIEQRRTARQMHNDLVKQGTGAPTAGWGRSVRAWKTKRQRNIQTSGCAAPSCR
jgi:hypothetical protein